MKRNHLLFLTAICQSTKNLCEWIYSVKTEQKKPLEKPSVKIEFLSPYCYIKSTGMFCIKHTNWIKIKLVRKTSNDATLYFGASKTVAKNVMPTGN